MAKKKATMTVKNDLANILVTVGEEPSQANISNTVNMTGEVKFKLNPDAGVPYYAHDGDMGMDVRATDVYYDEETESYIYSTGIREETVKGIGCLGFARSSIYTKNAMLSNGVGVIDSAIYRGEIKFIFKPQISITTMAKNHAYEQLLTMPWWKKIFKSEDDLRSRFSSDYMDAYLFYLERVLDFAPYKIGDKIGQLVFIPYITMKSVVVDNLSDSERGEGGFGSTDAPKQ